VPHDRAGGGNAAVRARAVGAGLCWRQVKRREPLPADTRRGGSPIATALVDFTGDRQIHHHSPRGEPESAKNDAELLRKCAQSVNFLIAIFQRERMRQFPLEDRRLILRTLPAVARQVWMEHEP
jgi:hypothetical protein